MNDPLAPPGAPPSPTPQSRRAQRPRDPNAGWFIGAGASSLVLGIINLLAAALTDCMAECDSNFHNAAQAKHEAHEASFFLVLAVLVFVGSGLSFAKNIVGAALVALVSLGDASYFALVSRKSPQALPLVIVALAIAGVAVTACVKRVLDGGATPRPDPPIG